MSAGALSLRPRRVEAAWTGRPATPRPGAPSAPPGAPGTAGPRHPASEPWTITVTVTRAGPDIIPVGMRLTPGAVSRHLTVLYDAGLLTRTPVG